MNEIPNCFYLHLQKILFEYNSGHDLTYKDAHTCMKMYRIPIHLQRVILAELEKLKLVEMKNGRNCCIKIINAHKNKILNNPSKLYYRLGAWS